ncbi:MAG: ATP-binding cassette domain-containing protein, partial [Candidatus Desulforudis sp.]|nr:ATP-binding cassette domain-containing protein [Desulforudis sp.]
MIKVSKLNKHFGALHVLKDVDMEVQAGEVVCLIGASGSGKSTLLHCINFLETAESGDVFIEDHLIDRKKDNLNKIRQEVGMVLQLFNLFPHKTGDTQRNGKPCI